MASRWAARVALLAMFAQQTIAMLNGTFTYPVQEGLKFYEYDTVNVSYKVSVDKPSLWTFCRDAESGEIVMKRVIRDTGGKDGSELVYIDFNTASEACWFNLRDQADEQGPGVNSVEFSLSDSQKNRETLGLNQPATTSAALKPSVKPSVKPSIESSTEPSVKPTVVNTASNIEPTTTEGPPEETRNSNTTDGADGSSRKINAGARAAIGVGIVLGILLVVGVVVAFFIMKRRRDAARRDYGATSKLGSEGAASMRGVPELYGSHAQNEMDHRPAPQELAA